MELDQKNCRILNLLQKNCRMSLTEISKNVGLSVDSVKKRINKMIEKNIFFPRIQLRPRNFGFKNIVEIKIKLENQDIKKVNEFIEYLKNTSEIVEILTVSGNWDISIVIICKDALDLGRITDKIRRDHGKIISNWTKSLTTCAHKFEEYDMLKLIKTK